MSDNDTTTPTRRDTLKYGATAAAGIGLAGCSSESGSNADSSEGTTTTGTGSYSVTMSPMGTVEFESVPEEAAIWSSHVADYLVALGQQDRINSLGGPDGFFQGYYNQLPGVEFDTSDLTPLWQDGLDKEIFYELDSDVHHMDPNWMVGWSSFDEADFDEIRSNISPFFANYYSRAHSYPGEGEYEFYSIWEMLDKYAQVYQVPERSDPLKAVRDEMLEDIYAELPPQEDRPDVGLVSYNPESESFGIYRLNRPGWGKAHTRPLRANDGLEMYTGGAESNFDAENVDMEGLLEADPDILLQNSDWIDPSRPRAEAFLSLDEHPVGQELTAVKNDRLYLTGTFLQGPIFNLFQIELSAKQIYPDLFGQPPEPGETVPEGEQLFDRQRVADIINGDL